MGSIKRGLVVVGVAAGLVMGIGSTAWAGVANGTDDTQRRTINVVGTGLVEGTPDVLELSLGVSTREGSAGAALSKNSELAEKVIAVLKLGGVAEKDIQTSGLSIRPVLDDDGERVIGYAVENTVVAKIRKIDQAGKIVDAATKEAGNNIVVNSLYFSFDDNSALVTAAREQAVKRAKAQAEQLAKAAGVELGQLVSIDESGTPTGPPIPLSDSDAGERGASAPINPGTETTSVAVTLVYSIK